jgi:hypothetical protein
MQRWFRLFAVTLLVLVPASLFAGPIDKSSFSIDLPEYFGDFAKQEQKIQAPHGTIVQTTYVAKAPSGEAVIVTYGAMSGRILNPDKMIDSARDSLLKSIKASVDREKKFDANGQPARSVFYSASAPRPLFGRTDFVIDGKRMFQLIYVGSAKEGLDAQATSDMFRSFRVKAE